MDSITFGGITLTWLKGGVTFLDGGAMFGVVPKPLWSKKYPPNDRNQIELPTEPILVQTEGRNILIESGIGQGKLNEKQKRNFGVVEESEIKASLSALGLTPEDIDTVLMTHLHFDHACGLTEYQDGQLVSVFPNAKIITSETEWNEMRNPNIRSRNTYWKENWEPIAGQAEPFSGEYKVTDQIRMIHTGGHSDGHSIIVMEQGEDTLIHMADLMPTHAHANVLWVMAYDDYPMDSIEAKQTWMKYGLERNALFTFYHDAYHRAVRFTEDGKGIAESVPRT